MDFNDFISKTNNLKTIPLSGLKAHLQFSPRSHFQMTASTIPKKAAVLALFYPNESNKTCVLLTERATYKGAHSAQISFPGGKQENNDKNLEETALRETFEEVGVLNKNVKIIRQISNVYIPPSNFLVTPFIGFTLKKPLFSINNEVATTLEILLSDVLSDTSISTQEISNSYLKNIEVPCFKLNNYIIWGATAMMLNEIKKLLK